MLYIAIALALIVGGLVFYQQASLQSRTNSVVRTYSALIAEARIVAGELSSLNAANFEELLYVRGSIPADNWDAAKPVGQRLRLPFADMYATLAIDFAPNGVNTISLFQFNMPVRLCSRLFVASRASTSYANGAVTAVLQDENYSGAVVHSFFVFPSVTPAQAATYCRTADINGNGLVFAVISFRTAD
ncbi:MAG: hypothetical protein IOC92_09625 [Rhodobacter sp.]|nr:hypothetical protein [Rhodobacter sp.]MCA3462247.1 hypothetical protein [Rhodobacter sp.]MCA3465669.1 hypothetical protein [Rhodobacter sp.]MCA3468974.1 hypothetical protein [Rhodobacter sp.]MCA3472131.1 hypothetical protein [Rhodobacter sp.]